MNSFESSSEQSYPSFSSEVPLNKESEAEKVRLNWQRCVDFFLSDRSHRKGGWWNFPYNLIIYLYWRNESYVKGEFNPPKKEYYNLNQGTNTHSRFTNFCICIENKSLTTQCRYQKR